MSRDKHEEHEADWVDGRKPTKQKAFTVRTDEEVLRALSIKKTLESEGFQPPLLPEVALELTQMTSPPNVTFKMIEATVTRDPAVTARVISIANSALYSRGSSVTSLQVAVQRLGLAEVRNVAFDVVATTRVFRVAAYAGRMRELLDLAQASGVVAREVCHVLKFESGLAYLCGLLHDMGEAIILGILGEQAHRDKQKPPDLKDIAAIIDDYHGQAGARVCEMWELPAPVIEAVRFHHDPADSKDPTQMARVVAVTDLLMAHAGLGPNPREIDPMEEPVFFELNLSPPQVKGLLRFAADMGTHRKALLES